MAKVYVIGSIMEAAEINRVCEALVNLKHTVRSVSPVKTTYKDAVQESYKNIAWSDIVVVITKPDGSVGTGVAHKLCFAEFLDKTIHIIRSYEGGRNYNNNADKADTAQQIAID